VLIIHGISNPSVLKKLGFKTPLLKCDCEVRVKNDGQKNGKQYHHLPNQGWANSG
jgi:hypothetical protein